MPIYVYRCKKCDGEFEKKHGMFVELEECDICNSKNCIFRIPCLSDSIKIIQKPNKVGDVVKKFITDAGRELKKEKKDLRSKKV